MSFLVQEAQMQIKQAIEAAARAAFAAGALPALPQGPFTLETPADRRNGDLSSNAAMAWARELRSPPRKIAEALVNHIELSNTYALRCEAAGAGFLNFYYGDAYFADIVADVLAKGDAYGRSNIGEGQRVLVEFVSANPTGPMHMGNARGGALGDCLATVLEAAGYEIEREFYVNDGGKQIENFGLSLDVRYRQHFGEEIELPDDGYHGEDITQRAKEFAEKFGDSYLAKPEQERRKALVDFALPLNVEQIRVNLERYRIKYDTWFYESTLYKNGEVDRVIELLRESGQTYEAEGALWFKGTEYGLDKDFVVVRSNGLPTYIVPDIAYHHNKLVTRGFDRSILVLGSDHHGHTIRLGAVLDAMFGKGRAQFVLTQLVKLVQGGQVVRMSKRTGKSISLEDLLDDIPIDALRFLFNMCGPASAMDFDLDLAVEQSAKNPVYYCQYAHARICSIFRRFEEEGIEPRACTKEELCLLSTTEERELIRLLAALTGEIAEAARACDPARVTRCCMELAGQFHKFYNACRVMGEEESLLQARLSLCACVRDVLGNLLRMFKIDAPERM
ncbi:MAG: arginine--tRNA ligase [Oscillospiraceae bacterium]|nr:arginine--tRNA ligase [Oscillospiraceae bacterium]